MKRLIILFCLSFLFLSCTKETRNKQKSANLKNDKIVCDKFNFNSNLIDDQLTLSIDSDLPEFTDIIVSVSRSYWQQGNDDEYSIDYFKEKSNIQQWKQKRNINLLNSDWSEKLISHQNKMSEYGVDFQFKVDKVSNDINISAIVPIKQSNQIFGIRNENLVGKEVLQTNINVIQKDVLIDYPITGYIIKEKSKIMQSSNTILIGIWIDNSSSQSTIHVYEENGIIHVDTHGSSGYIYKQTATIKNINNEKRYYLSNSSEDEYFIFGKSNEMRWFDNFGLFEVYKKK